MSNKSNGTQFEREFAELLFLKGFWAHKIQDNKNGQPFDVIAAKNGISYAFDCKDCTSKSFLLSRMEENQRNAMKLWVACGNQNAFYAVRYPVDQIYLFESEDLVAYEKEDGMTQITANQAPMYGYTVDEFMRIYVDADND